MDINQIIIIAIIILIGIIIAIGIYFLTTYLNNNKKNKKEDSIFNPNNLVEETSLLNMMDEKKNLDFNNEVKTEEKNFIASNVQVEEIKSEKIIEQEQKINPFGIDMTMHTKDNTEIKTEKDTSQNRFIK